MFAGNAERAADAEFLSPSREMHNSSSDNLMDYRDRFETLLRNFNHQVRSTVISSKFTYLLDTIFIYRVHAIFA